MLGDTARNGIWSCNVLSGWKFIPIALQVRLELGCTIFRLEIWPHTQRAYLYVHSKTKRISSHYKKNIECFGQKKSMKLMQEGNRYTVRSRFTTVCFTTIHFYDPCPVGLSTPDLCCINVTTQASFLYLSALLVLLRCAYVTYFSIIVQFFLVDCDFFTHDVH